MRWLQPIIGERRILKKFAWFPITIDYETRWLETVNILQTNETYHTPISILSGWSNGRFVESEEMSILNDTITKDNEWIRKCMTDPNKRYCQPPKRERLDYEKLYHELVYAVEMAVPGQTRHETALQLIRGAQGRYDKTAQADKNDPIRITEERNNDR